MLHALAVQREAKKFYETAGTPHLNELLKLAANEVKRIYQENDTDTANNWIAAFTDSLKGEVEGLSDVLKEMVSVLEEGSPKEEVAAAATGEESPLI